MDPQQDRMAKWNHPVHVCKDIELHLLDEKGRPILHAGVPLRHLPVIEVIRTGQPLETWNFQAFKLGQASLE